MVSSGLACGLRALFCHPPFLPFPPIDISPLLAVQLLFPLPSVLGRQVPSVLPLCILPLPLTTFTTALIFFTAL